MGKVILDITMSLDGFIAGPNMGEGGLRLHDWIFGAKTSVDEEIMEETVENSGAVIVGGRTYDIAIEEAWGGVSPFLVPAFVVCSEIPKPAKKVPGFTFVTWGIDSAIAHAREVARGKDVWVMGGANIAQQFLRAGLFDELQIHVAPVLFGRGIRLFEQFGNDRIELKSTRVIESPGAVHLRYSVVN
ncbi:dihydrofolate reductase [Cohnella lupini]|uniref:Dihydrofolate reductase n=2 Tax=Cohnella lupini TaxID=1294267 RepID=A0A3D9I0M0_9BACL|nr:dihydrofolate reductase [Cohnella lupini]